MKTTATRKALAENPFLQLLGIELNRLDYGEAICRLPLKRSGKVVAAVVAAFGGKRRRRRDSRHHCLAEGLTL